MKLLQKLVARFFQWLGHKTGKAELIEALGFGTQYLRPYLLRFVTGIALGILFGSLNGAFVGASYLLISRLSSETDKGVKKTAIVQMASATFGEQRPPTAPPDEVRPAKPQSGLRQWWSETSAKLAVPVEPLFGWFKHLGEAIKARAVHAFTHYIDPWLPLRGRDMDWMQLTGGFLLLPLLAALRGGLGYASSYCMAWTSQRVVMDLKADVFNKLNSLSLDFFNKSTTATLITRLNGDTSALNGCLRLGLSDLVKEPISILGIFFTLLLCDWQLTLLAIVFVPLMVVPIRVISKKIRTISRTAYDVDLKQGSLVLDAFANIRIVQAFGLQDQQCKDFIDQNRRSMRLGLRSLQAKEILNPIIEVFAGLILALVIIFVFATNRTSAEFMAFSVALGMFFTPFKKLTGIHLYFIQAEVPLRNLMNLFKMEPTVKERADAVRLPVFRESIRLREVAFHYLQDKPVLRGVNIDIARGTKVGLAGESGSGKSTLINLLFRFYDPTGGQLEVDGVDMRALSLADMRSHMALVSQDTLLFNTSVANNIGFGKIAATRGEVIAAAKRAHAHDFIMNMPQGYDTQIGERGVLISGGQRQRLAIARAFVRNAPILVLDEATASLDSRSEAEVQQAIEGLAEGRTVICIAHRLSTLASMDTIYVLRQGEVIEQGSFQQLLRQGGAFAAMAKHQSITAKPLA